MFQCEFCNKDYSTLSSLNYHKKTTKFCLYIQKERSSNILREESIQSSNETNIQNDKEIQSNNIEYTCNYCSKTFLRKHVYDKHLKKCTERDLNYQTRLQLEEMKKHNTTLQLQLEESNNKNKSLNDEVISLKTQLELLKNSKSNVTNITNNHNHITQFNDCFKQLNPFTEQNVQNAVSRILSSNSIIEGEERYMSDFIQAIKPMILVTDPTRNRICVKTDNGKKQRSDSTSVIRTVYRQTKKEHENIIKSAMDEGPEYNISNLEKWNEISTVVSGIRDAIYDSNKNKKNKLVDKIATRLNKEYVKEE
jgi:hypothetical protein